MTNVKVKTTKPKKESKKKVGFKISKEPYGVAMPDGFSFKTHKPLKKANFTEEFIYFGHRAEYAKYQVGVWEAKAEESKKLGSTKSRRQKKAVVRLQDKMTELREQLEKQGIDVTALLAASGVTVNFPPDAYKSKKNK